MKYRALVLDDYDIIISMLTEFLTNRDYEVFSFNTPMVCPLQLIPECNCNENEVCVDVIISDIEMPGMTGLSFIENHREKGCKCQNVAVISGSWTANDLAKAEELGCKIFHKPFSMEKLGVWLDGVEKDISPTRELRDWFKQV